MILILTLQTLTLTTQSRLNYSPKPHLWTRNAILMRAFAHDQATCIICIIVLGHARNVSLSSSRFQSRITMLTPRERTGSQHRFWLKLRVRLEMSTLDSSTNELSRGPSRFIEQVCRYCPMPPRQQRAMVVYVVCRCGPALLILHV